MASIPVSLGANTTAIFLVLIFQTAVAIPLTDLAAFSIRSLHISQLPETSNVVFEQPGPWNLEPLIPVMQAYPCQALNCLVLASFHPGVAFAGMFLPSLVLVSPGISIPGINFSTFRVHHTGLCAEASTLNAPCVTISSPSIRPLTTT